LTKGKIRETDSCHLDPDLRSESLSRLSGWRPAFGQVGPAQGHLNKQGVSVGDIFLFFGWFQRTEYKGNRLVYDRTDKGFHLLYGWLQIAEILNPTLSVLDRFPWLADHPHCNNIGYWPKSNTIYLASDNLHVKRQPFREIAGGGAFPQYKESLQLSFPGQNRSVWRLPKWFYPKSEKSALTYHQNLNRWKIFDEYTILETVGRGQEFVLDSEDYPEAEDWVLELIGNGSRLSSKRIQISPHSTATTEHEPKFVDSNSPRSSLQPKSISYLLASIPKDKSSRILSAYEDFVHILDAHLSYSPEKTGRGLELLPNRIDTNLSKTIADESAKSITLLKAAYLFAVIYMEMLLGFLCEKPSISFNNFLKHRQSSKINVSELTFSYSIAVYRNKFIAHHDKFRIQSSSSKIRIGELRLLPIGWGIQLAEEDRNSLETLEKKYLSYEGIESSSNPQAPLSEIATKLFYLIPPSHGKDGGHERLEINRLAEIIGVHSLTAKQLLDSIDSFTSTIANHIIGRRS